MSSFCEEPPEDRRIATIRQMGNRYEMHVPGQPIGITYNPLDILEQRDNLENLGYRVVEDPKYPIVL